MRKVLILILLTLSPGPLASAEQIYGVDTITPGERKKLELVRDQIKACDDKFGSEEQVCDLEAVFASLPENIREYAAEKCKTASDTTLLRSLLVDLTGYRYYQDRDDCERNIRLMMQSYLIGLRSYEKCNEAGRKRRACLGDLKAVSRDEIEQRLRNYVDPAEAPRIAAKRRAAYLEGCRKQYGEEKDFQLKGLQNQREFREAMMACRAIPSPERWGFSFLWSRDPQQECLQAANHNGAIKSELLWEESKPLKRCLEAAPPAPPQNASEASGAEPEPQSASLNAN